MLNMSAPQQALALKKRSCISVYLALQVVSGSGGPGLHCVELPEIRRPWGLREPSEQTSPAKAVAYQAGRKAPLWRLGAGVSFRICCSRALGWE